MTDPKVELYIAGAWTDITTYTQAAGSQLSITRGRQNEQRTAEPSRCTFALNNRDGRFSPRNPAGPYYGQIGRNTQVRVSVTGRGYRYYGEISEWPTTWDQSGQDAWATVAAAGIMRRLGQGAPPLQGPITRFATSPAAPVAYGYWPLTDPVGSSAMASLVAGVGAMAIDGTATPKLASDATSFPTSDPLPVLNATSFRGVPGAYSGNTYQYFLVSVPLAGDTNDSILYRVLTTGTAFRWELRYYSASGGQLSLKAFDSTGATLVNTALAFAMNGVPSIVEIDLVQSGGTVFYTVGVTPLATGAGTTVSGSLTSTVGTAYQVQINADRALLTTSVGHVTLLNSAPGTFVTAFRGYIGETAGRRIQRLCTEEGIPFVYVGNLDNTEPMGLQTAGGLLDLLSECEASDMGHLYEPRDSFGLAYRTRESQYGAAVVLPLTYSQITSIQPTEDDQNTRNDVIVTRKYGSSARSTLTAGTLSTAAPPNGVGRYQDTLTLSLASDAQLQYQADWRVSVGTIDEPRYPTIGVDLAGLADPTAAAAADIGDQLTITATPIWVPPTGVQARIYGYAETYWPLTAGPWLIEYNCQPGTPYDDALVLNSATMGRLDSSTSVTAGTLPAATGSGVTLSYTGGDWITTAGYPTEFPFDVLITGEQLTVTAGTSTGAGTGTLTVTRAVNGVVKSHAAGEAIRLADPNRLVL